VTLETTKQRSEYVTLAIDVAREAGARLRELFGRLQDYELKTGHQDLVTDADREAEALILARLRAAYPEHEILSEESDFQSQARKSEAQSSLQASQGPAAERFRWVVDPLDGTTNFAHGVPFFAVSIALEEQNEPIVGVIYDPMHEELFAAVRGEGAWLNGQPICVSDVDELKRSLLATGFPTRSPLRERNLDYMGRFLPLAQSLRRFGSAALGLAYVACGRLEGYWELTLHRWDLAAGILLVEEAGGRVSRPDGQPVGPSDREVVASNGRIHEAMLRVFSE
jgi:myo-inositol-1(or 4)-monophosphatase